MRAWETDTLSDHRCIPNSEHDHAGGLPPFPGDEQAGLPGNGGVQHPAQLVDDRTLDGAAPVGAGGG